MTPCNVVAKLALGRFPRAERAVPAEKMTAAVGQGTAAEHEIVPGLLRHRKRRPAHLSAAAVAVPGVTVVAVGAAHSTATDQPSAALTPGAVVAFGGRLHGVPLPSLGMDCLLFTYPVDREELPLLHASIYPYIHTHLGRVF